VIFIFLSSGLFLGWSLGANDAANVFGTAVGTRMLRFRTAAVVCSVFVVIGAVSGGAGATNTLGKLGAVNALAGSFMVALAAAMTVFGMTRLRLPVSTSQAIVGAIVGWNFFSGSLTDYHSLQKIVLTWVLCPVLAGVFAIGLFSLYRAFLSRSKIHLLEQDMYTRWGLLLAGAFGAYSLGANNIANVMGVFVPLAPFGGFDIGGLFVLSPAQVLFFLGGMAIAVGVFTYSRRVMETVGGNLFKLSPEAALIVVLSQALVLFIFASEGLEGWLRAHGLPTIPLVPVSSSQAVVGAIIGIGILKGGQGIRFRVLGEIASGWITTPIVSCLIAFIALFFLQNVFSQQVARPTQYTVTESVLAHLNEEGLADPGIRSLLGRDFDRALSLDAELKGATDLDSDQRREVISVAEVANYYLDPDLVASKLGLGWFSPGQLAAIQQITGQTFNGRGQLHEALESASPEWSFTDAGGTSTTQNKILREKLDYLVRTFRVNK